mmetsp:Transcript_11092/g.37602  ORF Transcript_11092/g.37602 Transcript_11092/m.37602 type:complete len:438 (-) Transcript_11092:138-1451(-)
MGRVAVAPRRWLLPLRAPGATVALAVAAAFLLSPPALALRAAPPDVLRRSMSLGAQQQQPPPSPQPFRGRDGRYLRDAVPRKMAAVDRLLRDNGPESDLQLRLSYMREDLNMNLTRALRRDIHHDDDVHRCAVVVDLKRRSPTMEPPEVLSFDNSGRMASLFALSGADAIMVNTDEVLYGGDPEDIRECFRALRATPGPVGSSPPPLLCKDLILHPIQVAQAVEFGASAVVLVACVVGGHLTALLDACTIMGVDAVVEVHTLQELDNALAEGATFIMVNQWDRITGQLHPRQAETLRRRLPTNVVSLACGGMYDLDTAVRMADAGFDAVVLGRGLVACEEPSALIRDIRSHKGLPRVMMGWGATSNPREAATAHSCEHEHEHDHDHGLDAGAHAHVGGVDLSDGLEDDGELLGPEDVEGDSFTAEDLLRQARGEEGR